MLDMPEILLFNYFQGFMFGLFKESECPLGN